MGLRISCGTLIVNKKGQLLLCHVTNTEKWDIPKGIQDPGESTLQAAMRELHEEAGITFDENLFEDLGCFDYRNDKKLHLYRVRAPDNFDSLNHLICTSHFPHHVTGCWRRCAFDPGCRKSLTHQNVQQTEALCWIEPNVCGSVNAAARVNLTSAPTSVRLNLENERFLQQFLVWAYNARIKNIGQELLKRPLPNLNCDQTKLKAVASRVPVKK